MTTATIDKNAKVEDKKAETAKTAPKPAPPKRVAQAKVGERAAEDKIVKIKPENREAALAEKRKNSSMKIQALFHNDTSALALLTPDKLQELAFISTYRSQDAQSTSPRRNGYQREPMPSRFPSIGNYYAKNDNRSMITPLIISARIYSAQGRKRFNTLFDKGDVAAIHKEFTKSVFSIIDGQHRAGGLHWAWENIEGFNTEVPVMIFYGLHYAEEAVLFDDINTNQRKLPKALIEATKVHMEAGSGTHAQTIREISESLALDGNSVWYGLVNMEGTHDPAQPVSYEGLRRATATMLPDRIMNRLEDRDMDATTVAKQYWAQVSRACAVAWDNHMKPVKDPETGEVTEVAVAYRLKDLAGVASISRLGGDIISTALDQSKTEDEFWDAVTDRVSKLGVVDWEKTDTNPWQRGVGAGFAGAKGMYKILYDLIYRDKMPGVDA